MLRLFTNRTTAAVVAASRRRIHLSPYRLSSSPPPEKSIDYPKNVTNSNRIPPPPPPILHHRKPLTYAPSSFSRTSIFAFSATLVSAIAASLAVVGSQDSGESRQKSGQKSSRVYEDFQHGIDRSNESVRRIVNTMKQTGVAASVLWKSLWSVLSSANQEVRLGFEVRVAALLADIAAANESRRQALVGAGGGVVLDWLLDTVAVAGDNCLTQAESARALAYLIADPNVCQVVLGRPNAVPNLLRFIFSAQPQAQRSKKQPRRSSFDISDSLKGRSMLVAAIMDIVTSNCDTVDMAGLKPVLPGNAAMRDISAAIQVIEEGGMHLDEKPGSEEDDDGGKGIKGIGIKVLGGTSVLGLSRTTNLMAVDHSIASHIESDKHAPKTHLFNKVGGNPSGQNNVSSAVIPGLWDDLLSQHVAVPFAAWALANWAMASDVNRSHIQELDQDGYAVMMALTAPERSVKWHGSLVARLLLEDQNLPLNDSVSDWSSSLLSTVSQASKTDDIPLTQVALSAFLLSLERSPVAQKVVMEKGLPLMREIAKRTSKQRSVQEALAKGLESLSTGEMHLSLDEGQKWSGTLLSWVFGKTSTDNLRTSAIKILSHILEDYGPSALPISQGWLAILLSEILESQKMASLKGSAPSKSDKVKTQIDQANIVSATQSANQLAGAVLHLALNQLGKLTDSDDSFPLEDLFSNEPFVGPKKNLKKDSIPKINAADSALATLKGIKSLTEICSEDSLCQIKVADYGVLSLLRRLLLRDDYEKLAANEAYDASREMEAQEHASKVPSESSAVDARNPSSVRVAPSAHIRRHAARFLTILSVLPKVKKVIIADKSWCEWLEECANGKIPGCNDPKTQSYSRAILLNIFCNDQDGRNPVNNDGPDSSASSKTSTCPRYTEMIYLINPDLPHWKCPEKKDMDSAEGTTTKKLNSVDSSLQWTEGSIDGETSTMTRADGEDNSSFSTSTSQGHSSKDPPLDVVFVHGLRGGPFKTWRLSDDKSSTKSGLVEKIDEEAGRQGTFWPGEWLSADFPNARLFTLKYKTNLTQWSGSSLPLQEVSSMLLEKLVAAGIGDRPVVFVTHSMGGLVVKQMLYQAKLESKVNLVDNTVGVVFYSCPHFGSKLADMPWRMGFVLRPAPSIGELRSGSPRLVQLNDFIRNLHKKGLLEVLSFCETKVTPIVEGYGGWAFRMEIVPIESAYPGFGELVVLDSTDHVNSCKPLDRCDPSYKETLDFLRKLKAEFR